MPAIGVQAHPADTACVLTSWRQGAHSISTLGAENDAADAADTTRGW